MAKHRTEIDIQAEFKLIQEAQKNIAAFTPIYEYYFDQIFVYILKRIDDYSISGDITQQVFIKAINHLPNYKYTGVPYSAFLYRVAFNEINLFFRNSNKKRTVYIEEHHIQKLSNEVDETDLITLEKKLKESIQKLNTDEVSLLELRFDENKSFKEIAIILNISENNAKVKTYRAINKLKKMFLK